MANPERTPRYAALKQDRSLATRERLIAASVRLMRTNGFEATTAGEICRAAGVAEGTFFFHFPKKGDLLVELGLRTSEAVAARFVVRPSEPAGTTLDRVVTEIGRNVERQPSDLILHTVVEMYRRVDRWGELRAGRRDFQSIFREIYEDAVRRGEFPEDLDLNEAAMMLSAAMLHGILMWTQGVPRKGSLVSLLRSRAATIHAGLLATCQPGAGLRSRRPATSRTHRSRRAPSA